MDINKLCAALLASALTMTTPAAITTSAASPREPVTVVSDRTIADLQQPQAAIGPEGFVYVAFGADHAIYCSRSTDGGQSFEPPVRVGALPGLALGRRRGPRIVAGQNAVVITAISHDSGNVIAWRSADSGATWSDPLTVNDSPRDAREGLHAMAISPGGEIFCTWLDLRSGSTEIYGSVSTDDGRTFAPNRLVYRSPSGTVCECCHPAADYDNAGRLYVMWRNSLDGARDMYVATSANHGRSFSAAEKLGTGSWPLDACPMDGGYLSATGSRTLTTVWQRDGKVYRTDPSQKPEQLLGRGIQPWVAGTEAGSFVVWLAGRNGPLRLAAPEQTLPQQLADSAVDPMIAAPVVGTGPVVAVWESSADKHTVIQAAVVRN